MAATDYVIKVGTKHAYIVNKKKTNKKGSRIGWDKRIVKDNEILQLFEFFLRRWCKKHGKPSVIVGNPKGDQLYQATLIDTKSEHVECTKDD